MRQPILHIIIFSALCSLGFLLVSPQGFGQPSQPIELKISCYEGYAEPLLQDFETFIEGKYDVDLSFEIHIAANPDELYENIGKYEVDLITPSHNMFKSDLWPLIKNKQVQALAVEELSYYKYILPAFKETHFVVETVEKEEKTEKRVYGVPVATGNYALAYNADIIEKDPRTWKVLWEEEYQNKYSICSDYAECNIYITALAEGADYEVLYNTEELFRQVSTNQIRQTLNDLALNAYSFWQSTPNVDEMDQLAFTTTWGYAVQVANRRGMNWKFSNPKEGTTAWLDHWAITSHVKKDSLRHQLCMEWINYSISPTIQKEAVELWGVTPVIENLEGIFQPKDVENFNIGKQEYWENVSFWGIVDPKTMRGYRALWSFAISQKKRVDISTEDAPKMDQIRFKGNGIHPQDKEIVQQRYLRGKKMAQERREALSLQNLVPFTFYLPEALNYELTMESIDSGLTKNEILLKALKTYFTNQASSQSGEQSADVEN
ncbi:extracellular solute-binding protein [bacterium]|nr:extracellular solute-binding protein [bacterium]